MTSDHLTALDALRQDVTNEPLYESGEHFVDGCYYDLTQCHYGETGRFRNEADGKAIALIWNWWLGGGLTALRAEVEALTSRATAAEAALAAKQKRKTFPILGSNGARIDYQLVADHGGQAKANHYQTVDRLAERGGLSWQELHAVLHDRSFRKVDQNTSIAECRAIEARYLSALEPNPAAQDREDWRDDPASDDRWCAGNDYALTRLCAVLNVDPHTVDWDGSDGSLQEEADALIRRILSAGEQDRDALIADGLGVYLTHAELAARDGALIAATLEAAAQVCQNEIDWCIKTIGQDTTLRMSVAEDLLDAIRALATQPQTDALEHNPAAPTAPSWPAAEAENATLPAIDETTGALIRKEGA